MTFQGALIQEQDGTLNLGCLPLAKPRNAPSMHPIHVSEISLYIPNPTHCNSHTTESQSSPQLS